MAEQKFPHPAASKPERREQAEPNPQSYRPAANGRAPALVGQDGKDVGGWDAYRRWLSRVQLPDKRRIAMDPSLYTWKGYRNWAEKMRRDWNPEED